MFLFGEKPDINTGVQEYNNSDNAVLLDVREADEFAGGHIPWAVNLPLSQISQIDIPRDKSLYLYCLSGARSKKAVSALKDMGYKDARSIGGISSYKGKVEK